MWKLSGAPLRLWHIQLPNSIQFSRHPHPGAEPNINTAEKGNKQEHSGGAEPGRGGAKKANAKSSEKIREIV